MFSANNALFELDYGRLFNLNVGDVLFFASTSDAAGIQTNYLNIHHCSMVVDVDYANHYVCVLESGIPTRTNLDYCFTTDKDGHEKEAGTDHDKQYPPGEAPWSEPGFNSYRIFPATISAARKIYVAKPAWPNIEPTHVHSGTLTGSITTTAEHQVLHLLDAATWGFRKGDLVVARMKSNMNLLNSTGEQTATKDVILRVDGQSGSGTEEDPYHFKTLWRSVTRGSMRHVPNDRVFIFPIDDDYNAVRVLMRSNNTAIEQPITSECSFDIYRL